MRKKYIIYLAVISLLGTLSYQSWVCNNNKNSNTELGKSLYNTEEFYSEVKRRPQEIEKKSKYISVLLLGIDGVDKTSPCRSDCMIIATIDKEHKKLKLTSLMRDTLVRMTGHGPLEGLDQDRLNHAFAYGGPLLLIKTINENFHMEISDYVQADFQGFIKMIDKLGGVEITLQKEEIPYINEYQRQVSEVDHQDFIAVTKAGKQNLNGKQVMGYCRVRYVGNNDFERTERQRIVLKELLKKISQKNIIDIASLAEDILPYVKTNMDRREIFSVVYYILSNQLSSAEQLRLPSDDLSYTVYVRGQYFIDWKKEETVRKLYDFIYETK